MKRGNLGLITGILTAALLLPGCAKKEEVAPAGPPVVMVTTAVKDDVPVFSEAIATLEGSTNSQIYAQVNGYLMTKNYNEGTEVKEGDLLFQIDPKPFQANLDKALAALQNNQAQLKRTQQDLARYETLVKSGAVSQQEYQNEVQLNDANHRRPMWTRCPRPAVHHGTDSISVIPRSNRRSISGIAGIADCPGG